MTFVAFPSLADGMFVSINWTNVLKGEVKETTIFIQVMVILPVHSNNHLTIAIEVR